MTSINDNGGYICIIDSLADSQCSLCIPSKFPVKFLAYQAMSSQFERLRTAGEDVLLSSVLKMWRLLRIVDEILGIEL